MQQPKPTSEMLQHVRLGLRQHTLGGAYLGPNYLSFPIATGDPYTVIEFGQTLIVSGSKPRGHKHTFTNVTDCLLYLKQVL